jgi:HPt (histidine-containing phosphotransfer) domain-containing protein
VVAEINPVQDFIYLKICCLETVKPETEVGTLKSTLDTEALKARFSGRLELLKIMYDEFSLFVDTALSDMQNSFENGDLQNLAEKAHTLKGNAALIGAGRASELAFDVQQASSAGDVQLLTTSLPQLFEEVQLALEELKHFVTNISSMG